MKDKIPVLTYHDITAGGAQRHASAIDRFYACTESQFAGQVSYMAESGYKTITLESLISWLEGSALRDEKNVMLTFDDGHDSDFSIAFPALESSGMTGVFFVTASNVGKPGYTGWAQLAEMAAAGNSIGSHGLTHSVLLQMDRGRLENELSGSKKIIEDKLGLRVKALSIPRGFYDRSILESARRCGYTAVFTSDTGYNSSGSRLIGLKRIVMRSDFSIEVLQSILEGGASFIAARRFESMAKALLRGILGGEGYDRLKARYLARREPQ